MCCRGRNSDDDVMKVGGVIDASAKSMLALEIKREVAMRALKLAI